MKLDNKTVDNFVRLISSSSKQDIQSPMLYGTAVINDGETFIKLDGSEELTPVDKIIDVKDGDRVIVQIQDHRATVTGNLTKPATIFGDGYINFGDKDDTSRIIFSSNRAVIEYKNDTVEQSSGTVIPGNSSLSMISYIYPSSNIGTVTDVVLEPESGDPYINVDLGSENIVNVYAFRDCSISDFAVGDTVGIEGLIIKDFDEVDEVDDDEQIVYTALINLSTRHHSDWSTVRIGVEAPDMLGDPQGAKGTSIELSTNDDGSQPEIDLIVRGESGPRGNSEIRMNEDPGIIIKSPRSVMVIGSDSNMTYNGENVPAGLQVKTINMGTQSISSSSYKDFNHTLTDAELPVGYTVIGITAVQTNHHSYNQITYFGMVSENEIQVSIRNSHTSSTSTTVTVKLTIARI